jgi:hypothetical protein
MSRSVAYRPSLVKIGHPKAVIAGVALLCGALQFAPGICDDQVIELQKRWRCRENHPLGDAEQPLSGKELPTLSTRTRRCPFLSNRQFAAAPVNSCNPNLTRPT